MPLCAVLAEVQSGQAWGRVFDPAVLSVVGSTLWQALWSTAISGVVGLALGLWVGQFVSSRSSSRIEILLGIPFGVPTVVVGMAWVAWLGRSGLLAQLGFHQEWSYTLKAVVFAHAFLNIPWVALAVSQSRKFVSQTQIEASWTLGAGWFSEFRYLIWPHVKWAFAGVCAQVLSFCVMSFALVLILGGGPPVQTLETEIFSRLRYGSLDVNGAAICAFWELGITLLPWSLVLFFQNRQRVFSQQRVSLRRPEYGQEFQLGKRFLLIGVCFLFIAPYLVVLNRQILNLLWDSNLRREILHPLQWSLYLAGSSSLVSVFTAVMAMLSLHLLKKRPTLRSWISSLLVLPSGISVLVLSLGVWLAYARWIDPFEGSFLAMVILQGTLFFPFAFRILWPISQGTQVRQIEAAIGMGASPLQAFRWIELQRWRGPVLSALSCVAGASLGEVGAVSLFASEKLVPLPFLVSRWMEKYRFAEAQGVAGLLFLLSMVFIVISFEMGNRAFNLYDAIESK